MNQTEIEHLKRVTEISANRGEAIEQLGENNIKLRARIATLEAENARLTAANESMQEDAVQNTYAFELMLKANKEQAEDIRTQEDEIGRLRHLLYTHNIEWEMK